MKINLNFLTNYQFLEEKIVHSLTDKKIIIIAAITLGLAIAAFVIKRYIKAIHLNKPNEQKQQMIKIEENPPRENKTQSNLPKPVENKTPSQIELSEARQTPTSNDKSSEKLLDSTTNKSNEQKEEDKQVNGKDVTQVVNKGIGQNEQAKQVPIDSNHLLSPVPIIPPKNDLSNDQAMRTQKLMSAARGIQLEIDIELEAIDEMLKEPNRPESETTTLLQMKKDRSKFHDIELNWLKMEKERLSYLRDTISSTEKELNNNKDQCTTETEKIDKLRNEIEEKENSIIILEKNIESLSHGIFQRTQWKVSYQPDDVITLGSGQTVIARDYKGKLTHEVKLEKEYPLMTKEMFEWKDKNEQIEFIKDKTCVYIIQGVQYNWRIVDTVEYYIVGYYKNVKHVYQLETKWNHDGIIPSIEIKALMLNEYWHKAEIIVEKSLIWKYSENLKDLKRRLEYPLKKLEELNKTIARLNTSLQENKAKFNEDDLKKVEDKIAALQKVEDRIAAFLQKK